ncbi:pyruvate formate lyase family protein, partial [Treponema sp. R6D11]
MEKFEQMINWLTRVYVNSLNIIHYMHDKYCYERLQMALHDRDIVRTMATGIAGLSVVADSLSAIKWAKVKPIRNENDLIIDFVVEGDYPKFGNNNDKVDGIASKIQHLFMDKLKMHKTYRSSLPTMSILT